MSRFSLTSRALRVRAVVHTASFAAAGVGAGLAQFPCSDMLPLSAIQASMIGGIAMIHGRKLSEGTITALLAVFAASIFGRAASQIVVGWVPAVGNAVNAMTAGGITHAIGWSVHRFFEELPANADEQEIRTILEVKVRSAER